MSTDVTWQTECSSLEQSLALAVELGNRLTGGEVIELVSDIGGGKTTFTRGLAQGIGSTDHVSSPTFTISNVYAGPELTMQHFDFYRLNDPGIMRDELFEVLQDPKSVTVIEWADVVKDVLPDDRLTIRITSTGENSRKYDITATGNAAKIMKGII